MTLELIVAVITLVATLVLGIPQLIAAVQPVASQIRDRRLLSDKFGRGPFDKATIERSTRYYIRPKCANVDPAQEEETRHAASIVTGDLFERVDKFLEQDDSTRRHLLILADSGTGKTSFVLNYYAYNARKPKQKRHRIALIPLGAKDADNMVANIPEHEREDTVIFLDALDEDSRAISNHHERIRQLMSTCSRFRRVVITCRTQFFPKDEEIPVETGLVRIGPRRAGEKATYEFWKLYLSPFIDEDVQRYLKLRYPFWAREARQKALDVARKIPLLSVRPMLLTYIPDVVASGIEIKHTYQLYEVMVDAWLERESSWVYKDALREFSERLAVDLYLNRETRGTERVPPDVLTGLSESWGIDLEKWQITGRSLLNRDAEGNYKFAHRSIMEYMFVLRLIRGDTSCNGVLLTDLMKEFLIELLSTRTAELMALKAFLRKVEWRASSIQSNSISGIGNECTEKAVHVFHRSQSPKECLDQFPLLESLLRTVYGDWAIGHLDLLRIEIEGFAISTSAVVRSSFRDDMKLDWRISKTISRIDSIAPHEIERTLTDGEFAREFGAMTVESLKAINRSSVIRLIPINNWSEAYLHFVPLNAHEVATKP